MRIFIDADGCPVINNTVKIANEYNVPCVIICDTAHFFDIPNTQVITVDQGADSVDFKLVNLIMTGDIAITQDFGLAAMCLAKGAQAINQNGVIYTDNNISSLLDSRAFSKKVKRSGGRLKGPKKRIKQNDLNFEKSLIKLIESFK